MYVKVPLIYVYWHVTIHKWSQKQYNKAKWHQHAELTFLYRPPYSGWVTLQHLAAGQSKYCIKESNAHKFINVLLATWEYSEENIKCCLGKSPKKSGIELHLYGQDRYSMIPYLTIPPPLLDHIYKNIRTFIFFSVQVLYTVNSYPPISFPLKITLVKGYQVIVSKGTMSEFVQILNNCTNSIFYWISGSPWNLHSLEMIATSCYQNWPTCDGSLDLAIIGPHPLQGVAEFITIWSLVPTKNRRDLPINQQSECVWVNLKYTWLMA